MQDTNCAATKCNHNKCSQKKKEIQQRPSAKRHISICYIKFVELTLVSSIIYIKSQSAQATLLVFTDTDITGLHTMDGYVYTKIK